MSLVAALPERLRARRRRPSRKEATGGLHATGLFSAAGEPLCVREDVGRHNALDKVVGRAFLDGLLPLGEHVLCVSGRLSFELVQKAAVAGCPILVAVGAPSSLAVDLAADRGVTLCGFVRGGSVNVYTEAMADRGLTGILLAGGSSSLFGSPKAHAAYEGETLADRAWRLLEEACDERLAVGPGGLADPGTGPVAAIAAGLRAAKHDLAVVIPVEMPLLTPEALRQLAGACRDAATAQHGPLPCAIARHTLPAFETGERRLRTVLDGLDTARVEPAEELLANVNTPADLDTLAS